MKRAQGKSNLEIVQDYLDGNRPFIQVGYTDDINNATRKEGEEWEDSQGRKWIWKNGSKRRVPKKVIIDNKCICKHCNADIRWGNYLDNQVWPKTHLCYDCFTKNETQMKLEGTWEFYDQIRELKNERSVLTDYKTKFDETLKWCVEKENKPLEFINEDGSIEKWEGENGIEKIKQDVEKDLEFINARLLEIDKSISNLEKDYESAKSKRNNKTRV
jgi:chaperonin cofactor prefoldin